MQEGCGREYREGKRERHGGHALVPQSIPDPFGPCPFLLSRMEHLIHGLLWVFVFG